MNKKKFIRYIETSRIWFDKRIKFDVTDKFEGSYDYIDIDNQDIEDYILDFSDDFPYHKDDDNFMNSEFELEYGKFIKNEGYDDGYNDPVAPESYENLLKTMNWQMKRLEVILLRGIKCERCGSKTSLQVHHKIYIKKVVPWCYPRTDLEVLCKKCHSYTHEMMDIPIVSIEDYMASLEASKHNYFKAQLELLRTNLGDNKYSDPAKKKIVSNKNEDHNISSFEMFLITVVILIILLSFIVLMSYLTGKR